MTYEYKLEINAGKGLFPVAHHIYEWCSQRDNR